MRFEQFLAGLIKDPEFREHWHDLDAPYQAGNLLIALRFDLDLTQQQLADRAGVKRSYIARIENGAANPTVKSLARILGAVGLRLVLATEPRAETPETRARPTPRRRAQKAVAAAR